MKPLIFLTIRSFTNGIRRSLTSGKRLIGLIMIIGYYVFMIMRPMNGMYTSSRHSDFPHEMTFSLPPMQVLQAFIFAGFAFLTLMLALSTSVQRLSFRPADVDVLFATPVNPKLVLIFRFFRDYMISLLIPLIPLIFGWRPTAAGLGLLFRNLPNPHTAGYVFRAASLAWILMALTWISISYAVSLFINRSDLLSDRNRRMITFGSVGLILALGGYVAWRVSLHSGLEGFVLITQDPIIKVILFTATAASTMVMAPLQGNWLPFITSLLGLLVISGGAILVATSQVDWMYDQAAARGFDSLRLRRLQQKGDLIGMAAERARSGKVRVRSWSWVLRIKARGPLAILWREVLIQTRMSPFMLLMFAALGIMFGIIPLLTGQSGAGEAGYMFLGMQGMTIFVGSMSISQSGFIEVLRRVDLEKPLPFSPGMISFAEVSAKAVPSAISVFIASAVCLVIKPELWPFCLAAIVGLPFVSLLCCSIIFLVTVLFPDVDDPTQRGFRGLMILLGLAIALVPVGAMALGVGFLAQSLTIAPVIASGVAGVMAICVSVVVCLVTGNLYASFNPSE